jgi:multidrug efflux pump subunit AcrA (membrane-fusion protein)
MNFFGKILTGLICIVALFLMWVSIMVYATHKNWKAEAETLQSDLAESTTLNDQLQSERRSLESQLKAEIEASQQEVRKLESEHQVLTTRNSTIQSELDQLRQQERANTAAVASTQANNETLATEIEVLREQLRENQQSRDEAFATMVKATDQLHQAKGNLASVQERNLQLVADLGDKVNHIRALGSDPDTDPGTVVPRIRGEVFATRRSAGNQLIEVTIGADDGIKPGHTVEVYRGERYLGRVEIITTEPDRAVGRVLRQFQQGQIQEGDHVATKLRVG